MYATTFKNRHLIVSGPVIKFIITPVLHLKCPNLFSFTYYNQLKIYNISQFYYILFISFSITCKLEFLFFIITVYNCSLDIILLKKFILLSSNVKLNTFLIQFKIGLYLNLKPYT